MKSIIVCVMLLCSTFANAVQTICFPLQNEGMVYLFDDYSVLLYFTDKPNVLGVWKVVGTTNVLVTFNNGVTRFYETSVFQSCTLPD